jgi:hypothetical protein
MPRAHPPFPPAPKGCSISFQKATDAMVIGINWTFSYIRRSGVGSREVGRLESKAPEMELYL